MYDENKSLIATLREAGYLKTSAYIEAFRNIKREDFVRYEFSDEAYINYPLQIGFDQTISQPATVAFMIETLRPKKGENILDIGSGSGWQAGLLGFVVGYKGSVTGMEIVPELAQFSKENLEKYDLPQITIICSDGSRGYLKKSPYDKIIAAAAVQTEIPMQLISQLKIGGRLVIPLGNARQSLVAIDRLGENSFKHKEYPGFSFVPLIQKN